MVNCLFLRARGWGIDHRERQNLQIPGGMPGRGGGGMVRGQIKPCITRKVQNQGPKNGLIRNRLQLQDPEFC